jgi:hypothetical protein
MIIAKTVIPNQYWILKENDRKIGNIEAGPDGFSVKIKDLTTCFKTLSMVQQRVGIDFEPIKQRSVPEPNQVHGYPTTDHPYNPIFDVKRQLPIWTQEEKSKSWFAAGWYRLKTGRVWNVVQCPKLITLQRYPYTGPFYTEEEACDKSVS